MGYKLKEWVMRPFKQSEFVQARRVEQEYFNLALRAARRIVERVKQLVMVVFAC